MQTFLGICQKLGLDQTALNGQRLRAAIPIGQQENALFLICGYDFIFHPNDRKFQGIGDLFVDRNGPFELNIGKPCVDQFNNILYSPAINASVEGTSWMGGAGKSVKFSSAQMVKAGGVRDGGTGNYNLQTKALEMIVADTENGLNHQSTLDMVMPTLLAAFNGPPRAANAMTLATFDEMRASVTPYWGADAMRLGLV
jgi:hypothetical protein